MFVCGTSDKKILTVRLKILQSFSVFTFDILSQ